MTEERRKQINNMSVQEFIALADDERNEYYAETVRLSNEHFAEYCEEHGIEQPTNKKVKKGSLGYLEHFTEHYKDWFKGMHIKRLVECEENLSSFIDCDLFGSFILSDEVILLYDMVRDECVRRVAKMSQETT